MMNTSEPRPRTTSKKSDFKTEGDYIPFALIGIMVFTISFIIIANLIK